MQNLKVYICTSNETSWVLKGTARYIYTVYTRLLFHLAIQEISIWKSVSLKLILFERFTTRLDVVIFNFFSLSKVSKIYFIILLIIPAPSIIAYFIVVITSRSKIRSVWYPQLVTKPCRRYFERKKFAI